MTTDLMLRGFESRTIRQPPPAPCATGVCGTRETTTDRRLAGGSFLFFPPASAVCRSVQAFDWRRAWAIRGTAMAIAAGASASGGGTCGPTATSAIGPSTTSSRHRIHTASSWTRPSPWREAARSRTTTAGPRTDGATPSKARTAWHGRASASPSSSPRARPHSAQSQPNPGRSAARTGSGVGSRPHPAPPGRPRAKRRFSAGLFSTLGKEPSLSPERQKPPGRRPRQGRAGSAMPPLPGIVAGSWWRCATSSPKSSTKGR